MEPPEEEALRSFYATTAQLYQNPELRQYQVIMLDRPTVEARVEVLEEEVERLFEARQPRLSTPALRTFVQAQFADMETANAALERIKAGEAFATVVDEAGATVANFATSPRDAVLDENVAEAVFSQTEPGLIGPIDGNFGVVIAEVSEVTEAVDAQFDEYREQMEQELREELFIDEVDRLYEAIQEGGDAGLTLAEVATELDLTVRTVGPVDRNLLTPEGAFEDGIPLNVHRTAFAKSPDGLFEDVNLEDGMAAFVEVETIIPSSQKPFEDVKEQVEAAYIADRQRTNLSDLATRFQDLVATGSSFEEAAEALGGETVSRTVTPRGGAEGISPALQQDLFSNDVGDVVSDVNAAENQVSVAKVESVAYAPNPQGPLLASSLRLQFGDALLNDHYNAYLTALQEVHPISQNDAVIASSIGNEQ